MKLYFNVASFYIMFCIFLFINEIYLFFFVLHNAFYVNFLFGFYFYDILWLLYEQPIRDKCSDADINSTGKFAKRALQRSVNVSINDL